MNVAGMTPAAYLTRLRMDQAREWLRAGLQSMDETAVRSGLCQQRGICQGVQEDDRSGTRTGAPRSTTAATALMIIQAISMDTMVWLRK